MLAMLLSCTLTVTPPAAIYVRTNGSDLGDGSTKRPLATIHRAVELARSKGIKRILVSRGEYRLETTLALDRRDAGLTIEAEPGSRPTFTGAVRIEPRLVKPCTDDRVLDRIIESSARGGVRVVDLANLNLDTLGGMTAYGFPKPIVPAPNELFSGDVPMTIARWPNQGFSKTLVIKEPGNGEKDRSAPMRRPVFSIDDRAKLWGGAKDIWLYGYWFYDWADENMAVESLDADSATVTLRGPHHYGVKKGAPFFAQNLLEELDQPGEYFIDVATSKLYFIPAPGNSPLRLSMLSIPLVAIDSTSKVTLRGIDLAFSRGDGIVIRNSSAVTVEGVQLYNLGQRGAVVENSSRCGLDGCNLWQLGEGGVSLSGGLRDTLNPGENYVRNCDIHHYQRRTQTYRPAVLISGVGNIVAHCDMHDAPHSAIIFSGNEHVIEFNRFFRTLSLTGDGGVVYTGRDWTARGTQIRYNHFFDNVGESKWEPAIYFDDLASGLVAKGNLIERCHWGFLVGGGRDNLLEENVIVDCKLGFRCDARGLGWAASSKPTMVERLAAVPKLSDVWRQKYPELVDILDKEPMAPMGNVLRRNLILRSGSLEKGFEAAFAKTVRLESNIESSITGPWNQAPNAPKLPIHEMGLVDDSIRKSLPSHK